MRQSVGVCGLTFELRGPDRRGAWAARRSIDHERFAAQVPCRGGSRSSDQLGSTARNENSEAPRRPPTTRCRPRYCKWCPGLPAGHYLLYADSPPSGGALGNDADRCTEQNQRFTSDWAARATRSRVFAAHGSVRRWRYARASLCCLTFELRRERRDGAWPAGWMMNHSRRRAKCHVGASRLQRRVRPHCLCSGASVPTGDTN